HVGSDPSGSFRPYLCLLPSLRSRSPPRARRSPSPISHADRSVPRAPGRSAPDRQSLLLPPRHARIILDQGRAPEPTADLLQAGHLGDGRGRPFSAAPAAPGSLADALNGAYPIACPTF